MRRTIVGIIVVAVGVMMLLRALGYADCDWFFGWEWTKYLVPAGLVLVGMKLVFGHRYMRNGYNEGWEARQIAESDAGEPIKCDVAFSGAEYSYAGETFHGAKLEVFMGGIKMDLRNAVFDEDSVIEIHTLMGGVELFVPLDVEVLVQSSCFIGGVNNQRPHPDGQATHKILVKANCMMGGVDLKA